MNPRSIQIEGFNYNLPDSKIAKYPLDHRDQAKLLYYKNGDISEKKFIDIENFLPKDSLIIYNETKVVQARMLFRKPTGALIEIFILEPYMQDIQTGFQSRKAGLWKCFIGNAKKWKQGKLSMKIENTILYVEKDKQEGNSYIVKFSWDSDNTFSELLEQAGTIPLPPYLNREAEDSDKKRYQTVFAKNDGSVAAPTAGLHFTDEIIKNLEKKGFNNAKVTLHVGAGTFKPVDTDTIGEHEMHTEQIIIEKAEIKKLLDKKYSKRIAVGTTSVRTLESLYWFGAKLLLHKEEQNFEIFQWDPYTLDSDNISTNKSLEAVISYMEKNKINLLTGKTQLLIAPGYKYRVVDAMFTNFHQPKSTLLLLVAAYLGDDWKKIYDFALENNFRFLSYGDSCLFIK
ncbi:MAG: S-adenosylmethionine:tRNA ribosyltransferase-isomerase [Bacteroidota bacterium]|nr:S-adenosylmethionine:tRNA ribosyltransferase-isomerase [Bacteroidota bacterium]